MNIIDIVKSLILPSKKKTSQDIPEFVRDLDKIKNLFPNDPNLNDIEDWEELWIYLVKIQEIKLWKHQAVHDPIGWYRRSYTLGPDGWKLNHVGSYGSYPEEILIDGEYCIYEYLD